MYNLRKPNEKELDDLKQYLLGLSQDEENVDVIINTHFFGVIDEYVSDCPAYSGKLMFAVYGMPEFYEVFIWNNEGKLTKVEVDESFLEDKGQYKLAYHILMEYFDSIPDEEKPEVDRQLKRLGL